MIGKRRLKNEAMIDGNPANRNFVLSEQPARINQKGREKIAAQEKIQKMSCRKKSTGSHKAGKSRIIPITNKSHKLNSKCSQTLLHLAWQNLWQKFCFGRRFVRNKKLQNDCRSVRQTNLYYFNRFVIWLSEKIQLPNWLQPLNGCLATVLAVHKCFGNQHCFPRTCCQANWH